MEVSVSANAFARKIALSLISNPGQLGKLTSVDQVNQVGGFPNNTNLTLLFKSSFSLRQNKDLLIFNLKLQLLGLTVANRSVLGGMSKVISTIINIIINTNRVAEVVRRHEGPSPKSLDSDEDFMP